MNYRVLNRKSLKICLLKLLEFCKIFLNYSKENIRIVEDIVDR